MYLKVQMLGEDRCVRAAWAIKPTEIPSPVKHRYLGMRAWFKHSLTKHNRTKQFHSYKVQLQTLLLKKSHQTFASGPFLHLKAS